MNKRTILLFFILLATSHQVLMAQAQIVIEAIKEDITRQYAHIDIYYNLTNLNAGKNKRFRYNIQVFYKILGKGSEQYKPANERFLYGDVNRVNAGIQNVVSWDYAKEGDPQIVKGAEIQFKLTASLDWKAEETEWSRLEGTEAAWRSVVLPGWGDTKVRPNGKKYWWISGVYLGLIGAGLGYELNSRGLYNDYQDTKFEIEPSEALQIYNRANDQRKASRYLFLGAGITWATDVILVYIRGKKNRRYLDYVKDKIAKGKNSNRGAFNFNFQIEPYASTPLFGLKYKF